MDTETREASGFLLVDKPKDWTSHDVVGYLRRVTNIKKIGHAGTLDPFATGLLIVGVGRPATKRLDEFKNLDKAYAATMHLGATTDTMDSEGEISETNPTNITPSIEEVNTAVNSFVGKQLQTPPMYSAKKVGGKKLYDLARKGITVERQPEEITIHSIGVAGYRFPQLTIGCVVSPGTYIRTLSHDIGTALKTGAYCKELRRTAIGDYHVDHAEKPKYIEKNNWKDLLFEPSEG